MTRVHQAAGTAGPYDAVTGQMLAWRKLLERDGRAGGLHAQIVAPGAPDGVQTLAGLEPEADDLLLIHYSGYTVGMDRLLELPQRKLLVYHNVTPAHWFWRVEPQLALACEMGRDRLPGFARAARVAAGVSEFNERELREAGAERTCVTPILLDGGPAVAASDGNGGPLVLSVGRLAPHKRPDLVIRAFALLQREHVPEARLVMVGPPITREYGRLLDRLVRETGASRVQLTGGLPEDELADAYARASLFVSLSEHDGFCIPLLEALAAGLPAVARPAGGMPEVGGDAVLWTEGGDPALAAELMRLALDDDELRTELGRRAKEQAERFTWERTAERAREALSAALA